MDLSNYREQYTRDSLSEQSINKDPIAQFDQWFKAVTDTDMPDPNAMVLATVDPQGVPSQRVVLLKYYDEQHFVFYTNLESQKAHNIRTNANVCLHFPWYFMERQVKIIGHARPLDRQTVDTYFHSRPKSSQLGAWASHQSEVIESRAVLTDRFNELEATYKDKPIPVPDFWGGYKVTPSLIEFWQGGEDRLHDRFEFTKEEGEWAMKRLSP